MFPPFRRTRGLKGRNKKARGIAPGIGHRIISIALKGRNKEQIPRRGKVRVTPVHCPRRPATSGELDRCLAQLSYSITSAFSELSFGADDRRLSLRESRL
jgi:hypothetical protein